MTAHHPDNRDLIQDIQGAWSPPPTDAERFDAQLAVRLMSRKRRRTALMVATAAAAVLVIGSHLLGSQAHEPPAVADAPVENPATTAVAAADADSMFWGQALDHDQRDFSLPGAYGALDTLFLQPYDQEL